MHKLLSILLLFAIIFMVSPVKAQVVTNMPFPEYAQSISCKVHIPRGSGSGVIFKRKDSTGTNDVYFVWTSGHLIHHQADIFEIIFLGMENTNTIVSEASISQTISVDGERRDAGTNINTHLICFSEGTNNDIALLQLEKPFYSSNSVVFDLSGKWPHVGDHICSVGAPHGLDGSYSEGVISFVGRKDDDGLIYDQTTCVIYPGSSGGGFFNAKGECIGFAESYMESNMNLMTPMRRVLSWAKHEHLEWALDPTLPMPNKEELKKHRLRSDL